MPAYDRLRPTGHTDAYTESDKRPVKYSGLATRDYSLAKLALNTRGKSLAI